MKRAIQFKGKTNHKMEDLMGKLEQICKCGVCLERLNEPKQLVCQHIFCQRCLMRTCTGNRMGLMSLFCPTCRERQPMIYRPFDVYKLKPPLFMKQVLEVLSEFSQRHDTDEKYSKALSPSSDKSNSKQLLNTKITSVYETINMDTLEHMTQIRTDEFGIRDAKVQELEFEVEVSKQVNSQLLIDNFIMKAELTKTKEKGLCTANPRSTLLEKAPKEQTLSQTLKPNPGSTLRKKTPKEQNCSQTFGVYPGSALYKETPKEQSLSKNHGAAENNDTSSNIKNNHIEQKLNKYLRKKALNNADINKERLGEKKIDLSSSSSSVTRVNRNNTEENEFCWRCLRRGHTGIHCNESKTVLGRKICKNCDMVGHMEESCTTIGLASM